jgi:hypothetical protein
MMCGIIATLTRLPRGRTLGTSLHHHGKDYGQLLYALGVMGWLMLVTLPCGVFAFTIWLIILIFDRASWRKRFSG